MWPGWGVGKGKSTRGFGDGDGPEGEVREQLDIDAHEKGLGAAATENIGLRSHSDNGVATPEAERKRLLRTRCDGRAGLVQLRRRAAGDKCDDKERLQHFVRVGEPIGGSCEVVVTKSVTVFSCTARENAADDRISRSGHVCWSLGNCPLVRRLACKSAASATFA